MTPAALDWIDALRATPMQFHDNGCSSPFRRLHGILYPDDALHAIGIAARMHDAGFSVMRLPGSGFERHDRAAWNLAYRDCLRDQAHPRIAAIQYAGLVIGSAGPWRASWREMQRLGWRTWDDYMAATDATVAAFIEAHHQRMTLALAA